MNKILLLISIISLSAFSQNPPSIDWQNTIGGDSSDDLSIIHQTNDGGYIIGGSSDSGLSADKTEDSNGLNDYWIVKLDNNGNIQWQNTIGGDGDDFLTSIEQTTDGGYILGGISISGLSGDKSEDAIGGSFDYWIVKLDQNGNIQWENTIGGNHNDGVGAIIQTNDGGYIIGGNSSSDVSGDKIEDAINGSIDYWVVKLDQSGNIQWQNTIGGNGDDWMSLASIKQTSDGGYIIGGASESNISGDKTENSKGGSDYWIVKLDQSGNIQWQNTIGGDDTDILMSLDQTNEGGFILGGYSTSNISGDKTEDAFNGSNDYWIVKIDPNGNIQWQKTLGGNGDDILSSIKQTTDNAYILSGASKSSISGNKTENSYGAFDMWVIKIDELGNIVWQKTFGGSNNDGFGSIIQTNNGGFIIGTSSNSNISGNKTEDAINNSLDYWVIKLEAESQSINDQPDRIINLYPNPTDDLLIIDYELKVNVIIYDSTGKILIDTHKKQISLKHLKDGAYFIKIMNKHNEIIYNQTILKN